MPRFTQIVVLHVPLNSNLKLITPKLVDVATDSPYLQHKHIRQNATTVHHPETIHNCKPSIRRFFHPSLVGCHAKKPEPISNNG